jgi:GxxExxY protein
MSESIYAAATRTELELHGLPFASEKSVPVLYKGKRLGHQRVDLIVDERLIVEMKSVDSLHPVHLAQVVSYLRLTRLRLGLLVNFNVPILKQGIRRVVR